jgi:hypothetical protein
VSVPPHSLLALREIVDRIRALLAEGYIGDAQGELKRLERVSLDIEEDYDQWAGRLVNKD